jgi:ribonuclease HII
MARKPKAAPRLPLKEPALRPTFRRERRWLAKGVWPIAGCDEAGRGPLAGPVVAAAVVLDPARIPRGLNDSKKLDAAAREKLYEKICATAEVAVVFGSTERIDRDNILQASLWALARAVKALPVKPKMVFVDGNMKIDCGCGLFFQTEVGPVALLQDLVLLAWAGGLYWWEMKVVSSER